MTTDTESTSPSASPATASVIKQQLESIRFKHNLSISAILLGRCVVSIVLSLLLWLAIDSIFSPTGLSKQLIFAAWGLSVFTAITFFIWQFLSAFESRQHFAFRVEKNLPALQQRLITSLEFADKKVPGISEQLLAQLWQDARQYVDRDSVSAHSVQPEIRRSVGWSIATALSLLLIIGFGTPLLLLIQSVAKSFETAPLAEPHASLPITLSVEPGDVSLQRGDALTIVAAIDNVSPQQLTLYIQDDHLNWRQLTIYPGEEERVFSIELPQLTQDFTYYVAYDPAAGNDGNSGVKSKQYQVSLFDLPRVNSLAINYQYPKYTGLENTREEPGGDILAPEGTTVVLQMEFNKTVKSALIEFEDGTELPIDIDNVTGESSFVIEKNNAYKIRLVDTLDNANKDPLDYYIRAIPDQEPNIVLRTPGKDQRVMPLEEVPIEVDAKDDYGLSEFTLTYSVVGGEEKKVNFLKKQQAASITGTSLLYLEDLDVKPGDVVSYSVSVADNNGLHGPTQKISDIYFLEVIPTDHQFNRANSGSNNRGGGGGGANDSSALVKTQKDVIAATWKLKNRQGKVDLDTFSADGAIIRASQAEVAERAQMSISRLTERGNYQNDSYQNAVIALQQAISEMEKAIVDLDQLALTKALQFEQKALQQILTAEAQLNRTQVSMNRNSSGGGIGQQRDNADVRELFEMEMGELENRYELPQQGQQQADAQQQNETLDKLKELARRQEQLTRSQKELARRQERMDEEQKRKELEQLRRQQEQLRQELAQLSQQMSQQQSQRQSQQQSQQQSSQSSSSPGQQSSQSQSNASQQQQQQLQQAMQQMQQAIDSESINQAAAKSQKALDALQQQANAMGQDQQQSVGDLQQAAQQQIEQIVQSQRALRQAMHDVSRQQSMGNTRTESANAAGAAELSKQQAAVEAQLDKLSKNVREIARQADEEDGRSMEQAHTISRSLRPIQEKMDTSQMILNRGMVNLSLRLEGEIEEALASLQRDINGLGRWQRPTPQDGQQQLADQVSQLRQSLQNLQQQVESATPGSAANSGSDRTSDATQNQQQGEQGNTSANQSDQLSRQASRQQMQQTLNQSRELARGLAQGGVAADGQAWSGSARSIHTQLTQQNLQEFLNRPDLLRKLLAPVIELENQLRLQTELNEIDNKLYSDAERKVPAEYKKLVEDYYRELSETKRAAH